MRHLKFDKYFTRADGDTKRYETFFGLTAVRKPAGNVVYDGFQSVKMVLLFSRHRSYSFTKCTFVRGTPTVGQTVSVLNGNGLLF